MSKTTIANASPAQLLDLLDQGTNTGLINWTDRDYSDIWQQQLDVPLVILLQPEDATHDLGGIATIRSMLVSDSPPHESIRMLAQYAKHCAQEGDSLIPAEIARAIYFLLVGVGRSRCHQPVSSLKDTQLVEGLKWASQCNWIDSGSRRLAQHLIDSIT